MNHTLHMAAVTQVCFGHSECRAYCDRKMAERLAELAGSGELELGEFRQAGAANERKAQALRETAARSAEEEALHRARNEAVDLWINWGDLDVASRGQVVNARQTGSRWCRR